MFPPEPERPPVWRRGQVTAVRGFRVQVTFPGWDNLVSDWLPVAQLASLGARAWIMPRVGAQVAVLIDEQGEDGVVLGGLYSQPDPPPDCAGEAFHVELEDGTQIDLQDGRIVLQTPGNLEASVGGNLSAQVGGSATLQASSITLDGPVTCTQTLTVAGPTALNGGMSASGGSAGSAAVINGGAIINNGLDVDTATIGGKVFAEHQHQAQGSNAITTAPI